MTEPIQGVDCQLQSGPPTVEEPWAWYLLRRARGFRLRLEREVDGLLTPLRLSSRPPPLVLPTPDLHEGDRVRVRSIEEIRRTLDERGMLKGCGFGLGQHKFCGQEYRVIRRVDRFYDEPRARLLKARNLVLLEGVYCDGSNRRWTEGCQRMCFYFWRTEWLQKLD